MKIIQKVKNRNIKIKKGENYVSGDSYMRMNLQNMSIFQNIFPDQ